MAPSGITDDSSLLLTLEEISQLIAHSHDPAETLGNIVRLVRSRFQTAVCSVYLLEPATQELVLSATVGLDPASIGKVRMGLEEGLTGLVGEQMTPVMVEDAFRHPRFKYFPEAGEDPYPSFLGVPLVESGALEGVLVVQTAEPRTFSPSEIRMLVTVAGQIASLVGDVHLLDQINTAAHGPDLLPEPTATRLQGVKLSPGSGVGRAYGVVDLDRWRTTLPLHSQDPDRERERLGEATAAAQEELTHLSQRISELVGEDHGAILQAQLMLMQDRTIENDLTSWLQKGSSAEGALLATLDRYVAAFERLSTPHFQERAYDLKDVFHRILWHLQPRPEQPQNSGPVSEKVVLVLHEASVMQLFSVDLDRLVGVVVEHGGPQSHAAILARSLGIPMVGQIGATASLLEPGRRILVDADNGEVVLDPPEEEVQPTQVLEQEVLHMPLDAISSELPRVEVNINLLSEVVSAVEQQAGSVGLYRSELLFLARRTLPSEDEQVGIYRKLVRQLAGRPVCIRTFDLRPDKLASYSYLTSATARALDWRVVLESPPLQQLFHDQIRAILRVAVEGPVRILVPLVTRSELLDFVRDTLSLARCELSEEELPYRSDVPLGVMIEVAAAIPLIPLWAEHVDFFALGTNDLTASALDLDRNDPVTATGCDPLHPGLLHLIDHATRGAHEAGKPISVCGEMAADPLGAVALAALGVDSLSVPVTQLGKIRRTLASLAPDLLPELRRALLRKRAVRDVRALLQEWLVENSPAGA